MNNKIMIKYICPRCYEIFNYEDLNNLRCPNCHSLEFNISKFPVPVEMINVIQKLLKKKYNVVDLKPVYGVNSDYDKIFYSVIWGVKPTIVSPYIVITSSYYLDNIIESIKKYNWDFKYYVKNNIFYFEIYYIPKSYDYNDNNWDIIYKHLEQFVDTLPDYKEIEFKIPYEDEEGVGLD